MTEVNKDELKLLAAMSYGEASNKGVYEEMAAIASVLLRQRDARGYSTMMDFVHSEPTYSFVVKDGSEKYNLLMHSDQSNLKNKVELIQKELRSNSLQQEEIKAQLATASTKESIKLKKDQHTLEGKQKQHKNELKSLLTMLDAYKAASNALAGGADYSNGAYFWDGLDIKTRYAKHFKVKHGIKITDPAHNIFNINNSQKLVIITHTKITKDSKTNKTKNVSEEVGRYDHIYESTAAQGGTIFWRTNPEYMALTGAKAYK